MVKRPRPEAVVLVLLEVLAAGVVIYAMLKQQWGLAGSALFIGFLVALGLYLVPRMTGPFEIGGKRFRFRGILVPPSDAPPSTPSLPPGTDPPERPDPPAPPGTPGSREDRPG
jgi:hypothetical protein